MLDGPFIGLVWKKNKAIVDLKHFWRQETIPHCEMMRNCPWHASVLPENCAFSAARLHRPCQSSLIQAHLKSGRCFSKGYWQNNSGLLLMLFQTQCWFLTTVFNFNNRLFICRFLVHMTCAVLCKIYIFCLQFTPNDRLKMLRNTQLKDQYLRIVFTVGLCGATLCCLLYCQ